MDLKSQNILLNRDQTVAKIADVGLSRGLQSSISNLSVGTLEYSAPEVLLGRYCNEKVGMGMHSVGMLLECVQCVCTLDTWPIMVLASYSMLLTFGLLRPLPDASGGYHYLCCNCTSVQADVFSYGVILWELVTHEQPMRGSLRDCKVPQECPKAVDKLIDSCMREEPEGRPSAKEICETIRQWQHAMFAKRQSNQNAADALASD